MVHSTDTDTLFSKETDFLHSSKKIHFREITRDFTNQQKFNFYAFVWGSWPSRSYLTRLVQSISQPEIFTYVAHFRIWCKIKQNHFNGIYVSNVFLRNVTENFQLL